MESTTKRTICPIPFGNGIRYDSKKEHTMLIPAEGEYKAIQNKEIK